MSERLTATRRCRGADCGAEIAVLRTTNDNLMPVDLEPSPLGRLRLLDDGRVEVLNGPDAAAAVARAELLYVSHFVSCPNGPQFRARSRQRSDSTR